MLRNLIIIGWRNLVRNKLHSVINVLGLSIGISACLVIFLIVRFELSFNKEFQGYERIYRIHSSFSGVFSGINRGIPTAVAPTLEDQFTGIESVAPFHLFSGTVNIPSAKEIKDLGRQNGVVVANPNFFDVFTNYEWIAGSPQSLEKPFQTVITISQAQLYFGTTDPENILGKEIIFRDSLHTIVAGIVKDLPFNTDVDFKNFISFSTIEKSWLKESIQLNDWSSVNSSSQLFIKLDKGTGIEKIQSQIPLLSKLYKENSDWDVDNKFNLQPLSDLHYNADTGIFDYSRSPAHLPTLSALILVALMLIVIGSINFINLETAQALRRAKEVGVRKVLGSTQGRLVLQFLAESFIITSLAVLLALPLAELALNYFEEFVPKGVHLNLTAIAPFMLALIIVVSFMAGLYPAFALSSYLPAVALKNQAAISGRHLGSAFLRKSLIVFQFTFAQVLVIATLIVGWQINYLLTKDLGFNKDAIIYFNSPWFENHEKTALLKNELENIAGITKISLSDSPPSSPGWSTSTISYKAKEEMTVNAFRKFGDPDYLDLYGIQLIAGKKISPSDTVKELLINETLMKQLGFSSALDAIGQEVEYSNKLIPIVGVVRNFHFQSLHNKVEPVMIADNSENFTCFNIQLASKDGEQIKSTLKAVEEAWKKVYPEEKMEYAFLDDTIKNFYETEQRTSKLVRTATALTIVISCLGLFGLASYTAAQRTKEIGIRKVLGATAKSIVLLLSKDFVILVLLAFLFALPLSWIAGKQWLQTYPYQVELNVWLFALTVVVAIVIALLTVGYQTLKAANSNPVNSLKNE